MRFDVLRRVAVPMVAGALVLMACSSDGQGSVEPAPEPPVSSDSTTTSEATTSTTTSTTTFPATTTTEPQPVIETVPNDDGSVPETTGVVEEPEIPANTMFDPATPEGEVEQVVLADNEAYKTCLRTLPACDVGAAVRFGAFDYASGTAEFLNRYVSEGRVAENVASILVTVEDVRFGESGVEVSVDLCYQDDSRQIIPGTDGGADLVVAEGFLSVRQEFLLIKFDDVWKIAGSASSEGAEGKENNLCR